MATSAFTCAPSNASAAAFRAWGSAINTALTTSGLTDTAATGQIDFTTVAAPGAANTFMGFKVYRFSDTLQGSYPVFLKVEFGSGNATNNPALTFRIGTAHDGAGTLTGTQVTSVISCGATANSASALQCWASVDTNRAALALWCDNTGANYALAVTIERTVDSTGAVNSDGVVFASAGAAGAAANIRCVTLPFSGGVPPVISNWPIALPVTSGGFANGADTEFPVGMLLPMKGRFLRPVLGMLAINPTDVPTYAGTITSTVYGASHTYMSIGSGTFPNAVVTGNTSSTQIPCRLLMRYE